MHGRRRAREVALQVLYSLNFVALDVEKALELFWGNFVAPRSAREFAATLVEGTWHHRAELDELIAGCSDNWSLARMSKVDISILRMASFEFLYLNDIPPKVTINEAVDLGKTFGSENSGAFINGILDAINIKISGKNETASDHPSPDREEHKCLVLGFFSDERPPRGPCGLVDWRLNGLISREIRQAHIGGALQEKVVIPKPERINTEMLILFGGGPVTDLSYNRVYDAAYEMANTVDSLKLSDFSFDLPGEGRVLLSSSGMFEAMVAGFFDFLSGDVSKLEAMNICLVTAKERLPEIADGIARFNKNIRHHGAVDFSRMESYLAELS